ncbi:PREDICTED: 3-hydroxyisobutyryl-CoA hydrolase, mitochondrial-like [Amphimedon queenslandica]|uniref:3-hydroxyisobutyryl-CoA hydrolase n=1 Tax=Amphimedon queenslandica TaxID=400682 RepID=A0AAN0K2Q6_AMPQE|nr:PREDICTED: 3-hydroxyisobutyryl-CoA hydrolase, mitochondrial-like [Amphimedon queenslandica]|eukprot:XP_019863430.1 PREDICTED: 3-hydroxyisobutyryl-CoA hydrolase, mitochondrial-like [Amphimedon queenslandica]
MYLALTGHRLKGRDVLHGGIATHLIGKEKIPSLLSELTESCDDPIMKKDPHYVVKSILDKYHKESLNIDDRSFSLTPHLELIDKCFSGGSVEDIQMSLLNDGSDWSINQLQLLSKMVSIRIIVTYCRGLLPFINSHFHLGIIHLPILFILVLWTHNLSNIFIECCGL